MRFVNLCVFCVLSCSSTGNTWAADTPSGAVKEHFSATLGWLDSAVAHGADSAIVELAESLMDRLSRGGSLYVDGDPAFCSELDYRAGACAGVKQWNRLVRLSPNDVVLIGVFDETDRCSRSPLLTWVVGDPGRVRGAAIVLIGDGHGPWASRLPGLAKADRIASSFYLLDTRMPMGASGADETVRRAATIATTFMLQGEMFAAASRIGKTMAMLASVHEPGGMAFDDRIRGSIFLETAPIEPIPPGTISEAYVAACREQVGISASIEQDSSVRQAAMRMAACTMRGGTIMVVSGGHLDFNGLELPRELMPWFFYGKPWEWKAPCGLNRGDLLLYLGYIKPPVEEVHAALAIGAEAVVISLEQMEPDQRLSQIRTTWRPWDGCVSVAGYPHRILPTSGVVTTPLVASLLDEARAAVVRQRSLVPARH